MDDSVLINYLKGELTQKECAQVEAWAEMSAPNRKVLEELYCTLFIGDRQAVMDVVDVENSLAELKKKIGQKEAKAEKPFYWKRYVASIAAFLAGAVVVGGVFCFLYVNNSTSYMVSTESGQRAQVVLPDGTHAWLNASTQLAYKKKLWGSGRCVDLRGEAYFEVVRRERAPFIVNSRNIQVCVLGTQFNVRAHPAEERVVTTLLQGTVRVDTPEYEGKGFLLKPGQTLDVDVRSHKGKLMEYERPNDVLLWINGKLTFEQATLEEIAHVLEQHFDVHFTFDTNQLSKERYTCEFSTDDDINKILEIVSLTNRLTYQRKGKQVHLRSKT